MVELKQKEMRFWKNNNSVNDSDIDRFCFNVKNAK